MPVSLSFPLFDYSGSWLQGKSFAVKELRIHPTARGCCRALAGLSQGAAFGPMVLRWLVGMGAFSNPIKQVRRD